MHHKHFLILIALSLSCSAFSQVSETTSFQKAIDEAKKLPAIEAIAALDSLAGEAEKGNILDTLALIHHSKGVKWYREDLEQAIASTLEAIRIREALQDTIALVQSHFNVARFLDIWGEYYEAVQHFERVVNLGYGPKNKQFVNACINLGRLERERGDYQRALSFLALGESSLKNTLDLSGRDSLAMGNVFHTTGTVYNAMRTKGSMHLGIQNFEKAAALFTNLDSQNGLAACYEEWGNALVLTEQYQEAILYFEKALAIHQKRDNQSAIADLGNNLSIAYKRQEKFADAKAILDRSIQLLNAINGPQANPEKASKYDNLAEIFLAQGQYELALEHFQKAITNQLPRFQSKNISDLPTQEMVETTPNKEALLGFLGDKIRAWQAYYDHTQKEEYLENALATLLLSDFLIDLMRSEHLERGSLLFWREKVHNIFESALNICYLLEDQGKAFYFLEKSKSILLLEAMVNADARRVIPDSLANQEKALQRQLLELNRQLEGKPDDPQVRQAILANQKASREFIAELKVAYPRYHKIRYEHEVSTLENLQAFLMEEGHLMIHYFYGEKHIFIMPILFDNSTLIRIDRSDALQQNLLAYINQFQAATTILNHPQVYADQAYQVYQDLMQPALEAFANEAISKVSVIMDGQLNYLPIEALLYEKPTNLVLGKLPYFNRRYELGYAYSATILLRQFKDKNRLVPNHSNVLGLAPFAGRSNGKNLPELVYSKAELRGIQKKIKGQFLLGADATSHSFMEQSSRFDIIHLSTHASASQSTAPPYIAFADQKLALPSLYASEIPANLVVLSACETGLGTVQQGEGVMSLARGFTFAGATSLISSLWRVNDQSTAQIFTAFYEELLDGNSKNAALSRAKLAYLQNPEVADEEKSPYYWAGFVFIGADGPLAISPASTKWKVALVAFAILAGLFFMLKIQRNFRSSRSRES